MHADPQRARRAVRGGAASAVRHLLQVHAGDRRGTQAQGRAGCHDRGGHRRRQDKQPRQRLLTKTMIQ